MEKHKTALRSANELTLTSKFLLQNTLSFFCVRIVARNGLEWRSRFRSSG